MTHSEQTPDDELEDLFNSARQAVPVPSDALYERIVKASAQQTAIRNQQTNGAASTPWLRQLWQDIGGMPSFAGLTAAAIIGVWIGAFSDGISTTYLEFLAVQAADETDFLDPFSGLDFTYLEG